MNITIKTELNNKDYTIRNTGNCNTGEWNTGDYNTGYYNTGDYNTGYYNTGDYNTGGGNTGECNTGDRNTGARNTGARNTGDRNTGARNTGDRNTGDWNTGCRNTGCWNSCNNSSGFFCTKTPKVRLFNKKTDIDVSKIYFPNFCYFNLTEWVESKKMTDGEKKANPTYKTTGGYLKTYGYKEAFRKSFIEAQGQDDWAEEKAKLLALPNFDFKIFEEISGITEAEIMKK